MNECRSVFIVLYHFLGLQLLLKKKKKMRGVTLAKDYNTIGFLMIETLLQAILEQVDQPKKDLEHNLRALLNETVTKMDIVSKDEMERQKTALNNATLRLNELQQQVKALEVLIQKNS